MRQGLGTLFTLALLAGMASGGPAAGWQTGPVQPGGPWGEQIAPLQPLRAPPGRVPPAEVRPDVEPLRTFDEPWRPNLRRHFRNSA